MILSAGAFGLPQLLQLYGIGAAAELQKLGIPVARDLPGVGQNLQDPIDDVQTWRVPSHTDTFGVSLRGSVRAFPATSTCCARTAAAPSAWPAPTPTTPR